MPRDAPLEIVGPSDVRSIPVEAAAAEDVNEALHLSLPSPKGRGAGGEVPRIIRQPPHDSTMFDPK
jgi:hypothetical protein